MPAALDESGSEDVLSRLSLIESMVEQGRESTRRWGEFGILWGAGSVVAFLCSRIGHYSRAWVWLNAVAYPVTLFLLRRRFSRQTATTQSMRFVNSLWIVTGFSTSVTGLMGGMIANLPYNAIDGAVFLALGTANLVSGFAFRWHLQIAVGLMYWIGAMVLFLASGSTYNWTYCGVQFLGEFCFGVFLVATEPRGVYV